MTTPSAATSLPARWPIEHVVALAPSAAAAAAARRVAVPSSWPSSGCDEVAVWGVYAGSRAEPYEVCVELEEPAFRCSCPSRRRPCKHGLALLLLWAAGQIAQTVRPQFVAQWLAARAARPAADAGGSPAREADPEAEPTPESPPRTRVTRSDTEDAPVAPPPKGPADQRAAERAARVAAGLVEFDRWCADAVRGGLTAGALAKYATWDAVAARLVDSQAPALANRVKRIAGLVGVGPSWHELVLGELGTAHLLAEAGRRLPYLDDDLADAVRTALGWTIRQADVLATAPQTDTWQLLGRSDTLEDRIVVRRLWWRGEASAAWALSLSFAAYGQSLDDRFEVGQRVTADFHRYPGRRELRCLVGLIHEPGVTGAPEPVRSASLAGGCDEVGAALAGVPWLERWPVTVLAAPTLQGGRWLLADHTGSLPVVGASAGWPLVVAVSAGHPVALTAEWTASGLIPLAAHLPDGRSIDVGPRGSFDDRRWEDRV